MLGRHCSRYALAFGRIGRSTKSTLGSEVCVAKTLLVESSRGLGNGRLPVLESLACSSAHSLPGILGTISARAYSDADLPDHIKVALPALSPTMEMGTIISWEKKEGDQVSEGDLLCEIETDKATMGFETPEEGYLAKIMFPAGSKDIPIGQLLCIIVSDAEDVAKFKDFVPPKEVTEEKKKVETGGEGPSSPVEPKTIPIKASFAPPPPPSPAAPSVPGARFAMPPPGGDRPLASPAAKQAAAEKGIDVSLIGKGSGMDGMITVKDVEAFKPQVGAGLPSGPALPKTHGGMPSMLGSGYTDTELTNMRKVIAKRLQASKLEIPHYYLTVEVEMDSVLQLRADINKEYEKEEVKLSVNDFIIKATALASRRVPAANSSWMGTFIREHHTCDVSVAVDTGGGLITPIVTNAESKGLAEISYNVKEMATRAKEGKLQPHEVQGGTITVSNLGMMGIAHFTAIINSPQSCILAVGGTKAKVIPVGKEGNTKVAQVMTVTLSCDHRVVDGAVGAKWLQHFKKFLEKPQSMLL